jgi:predicted permease
MVPYEHLRRIAEHATSVSGVGLLEPGLGLTVVTPDGAVRVSTAEASANYFRLLGIVPARGRLFVPGDDNRIGRPALLSYGAWQQRFGANPDVIGRAVGVGGTTFDVLGVLPQGFIFPSAFIRNVEIVTTMGAVPAGAKGGTFHPLVRLRPGIGRERVQAELDALFGSGGTDPEARSIPVLEDIRSVLFPVGRPIMRVLLAAAVCVLLAGCCNLAGLFLVRVRGQERDLGLRSALGATRVQLLRPVLLEGALLAMASAVLALLLTSLTFDWLLRQVPKAAYQNAPVGVDMRVAVFTFALACLAGLAFGALPAWRASRLDALVLIQNRRAGRAAHGGRFGRGLLLAQVALAVIVVSGAVLASRAFLAVLRVPLGFDPQDVILVRCAPMGTDRLALRAFYVQAIESLARRGDVPAVGASGTLPLGATSVYEPVLMPGSTAAAAGVIHVFPGYFEAVNLRALRGRVLDWNDVRSQDDVAVVSEAAARVLFPGRDPLGGRVRAKGGRQFTVVGVVPEVRTSLTREFAPPVYVIPRDDIRSMTIVVRVRTHQAAVLTVVRRDVGRLARGSPVTAEWWTDAIGNLTDYRNPRFQTLVLLAFAALALSVAALGVYAVVSFVVRARTHELCVRLALGARPGSLVSLAVRQALMPVAGGLLIGIAAARWLARLADTQLYRVDTHDPSTLLAAVAVVSVAGTLAAYLPSRRAARVDPIALLKAE